MMKSTLIKGPVRQVSRRTYSGVRDVFLFIPNDDIFRFEGEKMSTEENIKAIPKKPEIGNVPKMYYNIISPNQVADVVTDFTKNDCLSTLFAKNKPFSGDSDYIPVLLNDNTKAQPVDIHFENLAIKWLKNFQSQVIDLKDLPAASDSISLNDIVVDERIVNAIKEIVNDEREFISSTKNLDLLLNKLDVVRNYQKFETDSLHLSEIRQFLTIEKLTTYLIQNDNKGENWNHILQMAQDNFQFFTSSGLNDLLILLAKDLINNPYVKKVDAFGKFISSSGVYESFQQLLLQQSSETLDQIARAMFMVGNIEKGIEILSTMISKRNESPRLETFRALIDSLQKHIGTISDDNLRKEYLLKILTPVKLVLFHINLDKEVALLLLNNVISTSHELDNFLKLLRKNSVDSLKEVHHLVIEKLILINETKSNEIKSLEMTQLLRQLSVGANIDLINQDSIKEYYKSIECEY